MYNQVGIWGLSTLWIRANDIWSWFASFYHSQSVLNIRCELSRSRTLREIVNKNSNHFYIISDFVTLIYLGIYLSISEWNVWWAWFSFPFPVTKSILNSPKPTVFPTIPVNFWASDPPNTGLNLYPLLFSSIAAYKNSIISFTLEKTNMKCGFLSQEKKIFHFFFYYYFILLCFFSTLILAVQDPPLSSESALNFLTKDVVNFKPRSIISCTPKFSPSCWIHPNRSKLSPSSLQCRKPMSFCFKSSTILSINIYLTF